MEQRYTKCIDEALVWVYANYTAQAIFVCGSIIRGTANQHSDFDIYVIHRDNYRQRVQKFFNGVPCEIFINSLEHTNNSFETELKNNRPCTAHMLATGRLYFDNKSIDAEALLNNAQKYMALSLGLSEQQIIASKYSIALAFEDAEDVINTDLASAMMLLNKTVFEIISYVYALNKISLPGVKQRIGKLTEIDTQVAGLVHDFYNATSTEIKHKLVEEILTQLDIATNFFEWTSDKSEK